MLELLDSLKCQDHEPFECLVGYLILGALFDFLAAIPPNGTYLFDSELLVNLSCGDEQIDITMASAWLKCVLDEASEDSDAVMKIETCRQHDDIDVVGPSTGTRNGNSTWHQW